MDETTTAIVIAIVGAIVSVGGLVLRVYDTRAARLAQNESVDAAAREANTKELCAIVDAYKGLKKELEDHWRSSIAHNEAEIATLKAKLEEMEARYAQERAAWFKERRALEQRIASLERENTQLREKLDTLEAKAHQEA